MQPQLGIWKSFIRSLSGVDRCSLSWWSRRGLLEVYEGWTDAASAGHLEESQLHAFQCGKEFLQFDPNFCWKLCRLWSCPFIHTHDLEIAILEIPTLKCKYNIHIQPECTAWLVYNHPWVAFEATKRICKLHLHNVQLLPFPSPHWAVGSLSS